MASDYTQNQSTSDEYTASGQIIQTLVGPAAGYVGMQYDAWGRLTRLDGDENQHFVYDALGRQIQTGLIDENGYFTEITDRWYIGSQVILESVVHTSGANLIQTRYAYCELRHRVMENDQQGEVQV